MISLDVALARSSERYDKFNWWRLDISDPVSNQTRFKVLQPLHRFSVGHQPSTTWLTSPRMLFLQANWRTQARKDKHAIWNCRCIWSENQVGVQELVSKGLIDTVEEIKNGALDHCKRTCRHSYNESISVSRRKTQEVNKTLTLMWWRLLNIWGLGCG